MTKRNDEQIVKIENENIYLFIGLTGSGKSTSIHYLSGSIMKNSPVNGQNHIAPVKIAPNIKGLEQVTTSPLAESETQNIIPIVIPIIDPDSFYDQNKAILCDTPGK